MANRPGRYATVLRYLSVLMLAGCSGGPARVLPPSIDADGAGRSALSQYDADRDGSLSEAELEKVSSIKRLLRLYDTDNDRKISAQEIADRIGEWQDTKVALITVQCLVRMNGQP